MNKTMIALAILLASGMVMASPGDDGCVGNCGGSDGGTSGNSTSSVGDISNRNINTNFAGALAGANSRANSNANSNSKSVGVGIGMGGNSSSNANATGGNASSTSFNVAKGGSATQGQALVSGQDQANEQNTQVTYNEAERMHYSGSYDLKTVGVAYSPDIQATAGCRKPLSAGGGWMGGAFSFGTTFLDETCVRGELIRFGLTSTNTKTRDMTNELLQYDLAKELEIARKAEAKEAEKKVSASRSGDYAPDNASAFNWGVLNAGG